MNTYGWVGVRNVFGVVFGLQAEGLTTVKCQHLREGDLVEPAKHLHVITATQHTQHKSHLLLYILLNICCYTAVNHAAHTVVHWLSQ